MAEQTTFVPPTSGRLPQELKAQLGESPERLHFSPELEAALDLPFGQEDIRQDAYRPSDSFVPKYIPAPAIIRRLNDVFGHTWEFKIDSWQTTPNNEQIIVKVILAVDVVCQSAGKKKEVRRVTREAFGQARIKAADNGAGFFDFGYDLKAAASDGLRKAASLFGIGLHLYERTESPFQGLTPVPPTRSIPAQPFMVAQVKKVFERLVIPQQVWCQQLRINTPEEITHEVAQEVISGRHQYVASLGAAPKAALKATDK